MNTDYKQPSEILATLPSTPDVVALRSRFPGDPQLLNQLLEMFLEDAPARCQRLQDALRAQQLDIVARMAHAIKGIGSTVEAPALSAAAKAVELAAKCRDETEVVRHLPQLLGNLDAALEQARRLMEGPTP